MKRILCFALVFIMLIGCAACQGQAPVNESKPTNATTTKPTNSTQPTQPSTPDQPETPEKTNPVISGTFMQPWAFAGYDLERMTAHLQYLKDIGIDLLILQSTVNYNGKIAKTFYEDTFAEEQLAQTYNRDGVGFMDVVLSAAQSLDMQVYVGLTNDGDWWKKIFTDEAWINDHVDISLQAARQIYDGYKSDYPDALAGWYFWPEYWNMDCNAEETALAVQFISDYRDGLADIDSTMPMLMSPYITDNVDAAKTQEFWTAVLADATLRDGDIFCCQDSVGAGHVTVDQMDGYFAAMKAAADTKPGLKFWANNEDFTPEFKSADMGRFKQQLDITHKYADTHISFAFCHYRNPDMGKTAAYEAYKHYYETGELVKKVDASPTVTMESVQQGFYVNFTVEIDNSAGDIYAVFITKDGEEIYKHYFDTDADAEKEILTVAYTDLNLNVGPVERFYTVYTLDHYGNMSEEDIQTLMVYTVGM